MSPKQRQRKADVKPYALNKRAFDQVILYFRRMDRPLLKAVGAVDPGRAEQKGPRYKPMRKAISLDLWCDIMSAIRASMPRGIPLSKFMLAYIVFDSDDELERNTHAHKILGGRCHSVEQRLGSEFVQRGIHPVKKYMKEFKF